MLNVERMLDQFFLFYFILRSAAGYDMDAWLR